MKSWKKSNDQNFLSAKSQSIFNNGNLTIRPNSSLIKILELGKYLSVSFLKIILFSLSEN